jgi:hypothetical protein
VGSDLNWMKKWVREQNLSWVLDQENSCRVRRCCDLAQKHIMDGRQYIDREQVSPEANERHLVALEFIEDF